MGVSKMKTLILFVSASVFIGAPAIGEVHRNAFADTKKADEPTLVFTPQQIGASIGLTNKEVKKATKAAQKREANSIKEKGDEMVAVGEGQDGKAKKNKKNADGQALAYTDIKKINKGAPGRCIKNGDGTWTVTRKGKTKRVPATDATKLFADSAHAEQKVNWAQSNGFASIKEALATNRYVAFDLNESFEQWIAPDSAAARGYYFVPTQKDADALKSGRDFMVTKVGVELLGNGNCNFDAGGGSGGKEPKPDTNDGKGAGGQPL